MGLIVIRHNESKPKWICDVCRSRGEVTVFAEDEHAAFERHVVACAKRHEDHLRSFSMRNKAPFLFDPDTAGDVERNKWVREQADAILHGRKRI